MWILCAVCLLIGLHRSWAEASAERRLFEWGTTFAGLAPSYNVHMDCTFNGNPMCCSLMENNTIAHEIISEGPSPQQARGCQINRVYIPSPYESFNFEMAKNLSEVAIEVNRKNLFINYCREEVDASNVWLERVKVHMASESVPEGSEVDLKYLSRFQVTRTCPGEGQPRVSSTWTEWIEPLTIHARHPFGLGTCKGVYTHAETSKMKFPVEIQSADYVIVQSGSSLHEQTLLRRHNHTRFEAHRNRHPVHREAHAQTHNYFLDAGTSTFESSMRWFLCAYMQVQSRNCRVFCRLRS
jgi:hypothetical protein